MSALKDMQRMLKENKDGGEAECLQRSLSLEGKKAVCLASLLTKA